MAPCHRPSFGSFAPVTRTDSYSPDHSWVLTLRNCHVAVRWGCAQHRQHPAQARAGQRVTTGEASTVPRACRWCGPQAAAAQRGMNDSHVPVASPTQHGNAFCRICRGIRTPGPRVSAKATSRSLPSRPAQFKGVGAEPVACRFLMMVGPGGAVRLRQRAPRQAARPRTGPRSNPPPRRARAAAGACG